jgi:arylformamidase
VNIDATPPRGDRPVHTLLLARGVPVVEHLTGLSALPPAGATFTAVPPKVAGLSTFPVRAFAVLPA